MKFFEIETENSRGVFQPYFPSMTVFVLEKDRQIRMSSIFFIQQNLKYYRKEDKVTILYLILTLFILYPSSRLQDWPFDGVVLNSPGELSTD